MANASHALGAPEIAGTFVNPKGLTKSHLRIVFANGVSWEFDVPAKERKAAEKVVQALGVT